MNVAEAIRAKLSAGLNPTMLTVEDESHLHAGHAGARPGGQSHFSVRIVTDAFAGKSRVDRQRMVYALLADEFSAGLHALRLVTLTPDEDKARR